MARKPKTTERSNVTTKATATKPRPTRGSAQGPAGHSAPGAVQLTPAEAIVQEQQGEDLDARPLGFAVEAMRGLSAALDGDWLARCAAVEAASVAIHRLEIARGPIVAGVPLIAIRREVHSLRRPHKAPDGADRMRQAREAVARLSSVADHLSTTDGGVQDAERLEGCKLLAPIDSKQLTLAERIEAYCAAVDQYLSWSWMKDKPTPHRPVPAPDSPAEADVAATTNVLHYGQGDLRDIVRSFSDTLAVDLEAAGVDSTPLMHIGRQRLNPCGGNPHRLYDEWESIKPMLLAAANRLRVSVQRDSAASVGKGRTGENQQARPSQSELSALAARMREIPAELKPNVKLRDLLDRAGAIVMEAIDGGVIIVSVRTTKAICRIGRGDERGLNTEHDGLTLRGHAFVRAATLLLRDMHFKVDKIGVDWQMCIYTGCPALADEIEACEADRRYGVKGKRRGPNTVVASEATHISRKAAAAVLYAATKRYSVYKNPKSARSALDGAISRDEFDHVGDPPQVVSESFNAWLREKVEAARQGKRVRRRGSGLHVHGG